MEGLRGGAAKEEGLPKLFGMHANSSRWIFNPGTPTLPRHLATLPSLHHGLVFGLPIGAAVVATLSLVFLLSSCEIPMTEDPKIQFAPPRPLVRGDLNTCLKILFSASIEGGFSNDPFDPGGPTNHGLSLREVHRLDRDNRLPQYMRSVLDADHDGDIDIDDVKLWTEDHTTAFYETFYWKVIEGDKLPQKLAIVTFDSAVNEGVPVAIEHLQRSLGVKVDGIMGPDTLAAADSSVRALETSGARFEAVSELTSRRLTRYRALAGADRYFRGWARRSVLVALVANNAPVWAD